MSSDMWLKGILGVVVGDAFGCPVQFESRTKVATHPVTDMRGYGTFNLPAGTWTDDSSLTLALLHSLKDVGEVDLHNIMGNFVKWYEDGEFTPFGIAFDIGNVTRNAIEKYMFTNNVFTCGCNSERDNGNGSLMRIMPICLYCIENDYGDLTSICLVHTISGLTHSHSQSLIACGLYYFIIKNIVKGKWSLYECIQRGLKEGRKFYRATYPAFDDSLNKYSRVLDLDHFKTLGCDMIKSTGYVVDSFETSIWALVNTHSYRDAMITCANLGDDTDTICAIAGGLAGLYYGWSDKGIPQEWIDKLQRKDWIIDMCM